MTGSHHHSPEAYARRHRRLAFGFAVIAMLMLGLSYAAVPLYKAFCQATGFAGTPLRAKTAPTTKGKRTLVVRFDSNVDPGLPWSFSPEIASLRVRTGETATAFFKVTNQSNRPTTGRAAYNVTPDVVGGYFNKIACFCFSNQELKPGETVEMPVVFFLDPALEKDETLDGVDEVTLSYTFYPIRTAPKPVADATPKPQPKL